MNDLTQARLLIKTCRDTRNPCLDLGNCGITDLTELPELIECTHLETLILSNNHISDIRILEKLTELQRIDLKNNQINNIPPSIFQLKMEVSLEENAYRGLTLFGNPIASPPIEILKQGKEAVLSWFKRIEAAGELDYIYEAKLIIVGDGSAGKTSLLKRLKDENAELPKSDERSRGIDVIDFEFEKGKIAHIWDFGGQVVYYPVHRFFMTQNAVFVLLASSRQPYHNFDYWIPTIFQFAGKSPIIIGQTCHEGLSMQWNDMGEYLNNPKFNIITSQKRYFKLDLADNNKGLSEIKQCIIDQIKRLPHFGRGIPKSWAKVRNALLEKSKSVSCIPFEAFKDLCRQLELVNLNTIVDITVCCRFFHDIGVVLWYWDKEELKDWVILRPEWAMNAVYKIIDNIHDGRIHKKDFEELWVDETYADKHHILKKMMERFKIAFPAKHSRNQTYLLPAKLSSMPHEKKWALDENALRLVYEFQFMPKGIVNQLSAELSGYIHENDIWHDAVNLVYEKSESQIIEDSFSRKLSITSKGVDARVMNVLIMDVIKNIIDDYRGVKGVIQVPCSCSTCRKSEVPSYFPYDKLLKWSEIRDKVMCNESAEYLSITKLIYDAGMKNQKMDNKPIPLNPLPEANNGFSDNERLQKRVENEKQIPYALTNFEMIRTKNYLYIDKTRFIEQLENENTNFHFLIRPRKFGKSLFLSVLDYYYDIRHENKFEQLFGDLYIGKNPTGSQNKMFVLNIDFSGIDTSSIVEFNVSLLEKIKMAVTFFITDHSDFIGNVDEAKAKIWSMNKVSTCIEFILDIIKTNGKKAYIIIDEYDHFANDMVAAGTYLGEDFYKKAVWAGSQIRDFYETLKSNSKTVIDKIFVTGITPIMLDDLTSGFNISTNLSLKEKYNEILGFTQDEVERIIDECGIDKSINNSFEIEKLYNGYLFHENANNKLYNPTMIFNYFQELKDEGLNIKYLIDNNMKTDYGRLRNLISKRENKQKLRYLVENNSIQSELINKFSIEEIHDDNNFFSLLYYMGLLTIDNANPLKVALKIPNYSVKIIFWEFIKRMITDEFKGLSLDSSTYIDTIYSLAYENNYEPFFEYFSKNIMKYLSNRDLQHTIEKDVKFLLLPIFLTGNYYLPISELENSEGYTDIYLKRSHLHLKSVSEWIFEIKYIKQSDSGNEKLIEAAKAEAITQLRRYKVSNLFKDRTDVRYLAVIFFGKKDYLIEEIL